MEHKTKLATSPAKSIWGTIVIAKTTQLVFALNWSNVKPDVKFNIIMQMHQNVILPYALTKFTVKIQSFLNWKVLERKKCRNNLNNSLKKT